MERPRFFNISPEIRVIPFEGREIVSYDMKVPLAYPTPIDYSKRREEPISPMEKALTAVVSLHEGEVIHLTNKRKMRKISRNGGSL